MPYDIRLADNDRFRREQNMTKLCACKEQTKAKLLNLRIPGLSIQHASAEVENNPLLIVMFLNQHRGDGRGVYSSRALLELELSQKGGELTVLLQSRASDGGWHRG